MQDLLNIKNELIGGISVQAVSANELYLGLGLSPSQWVRYAKRNIIANEYFLENRDWVKLDRVSQPNNSGASMNFGISIEFAKHIAAMAKTAKGHAYRNYLINIESQVSQVFAPLDDSDRAMLELTRISPNTLKAITGERNNHKVREGYQALVQAGIFEEVRETREVLRYRPTAVGFDYISGLSYETPHFKDDHKEQVRFVINQFRLGLGFQVDLFIEELK